MTDSELRDALETHHSESYGWALVCCARSSVDAETVLQTVYLKALMGKARYDGRASFKTWLFSVIRRMAARLATPKRPTAPGRALTAPSSSSRRS